MNQRPKTKSAKSSLTARTAVTCWLLVASCGVDSSLVLEGIDADDPGASASAGQGGVGVIGSAGSAGSAGRGKIEPLGKISESVDEFESWAKPRLAVSGDGVVYICYLHNIDRGGRYLPHAEVVRWTADGFEQLGEGLGEALDCTVGVSREADSPRPFVAYASRVDASRGSYDVKVAHWDGSAWQAVGEVLDSAPHKYAIRPAIIVDSSGRPVVYWWDADNSTDQENYWGRIKRWESGIWEALGEPFDTSSGVAGSFALADTGTLYFGWNTLGGALGRSSRENSDVYVSRWEAGWSNVGETFLDTNPDPWALAARPSIGIDGSGRPVAAYLETREDDGSKDKDAVVKRFDGSGWQPLGGSLDVDAAQPAESVALAIKDDGYPVVAWLENEFRRRAYMKEWNGSDWRLVDGPFDDPSVTADSIVLARDPSSSFVYIAYQEDSGGDAHIRLLRVWL